MGAVKWKAASLFETVVAMVILAVVFGIALVTYLQVTRSSITGQRVQANFLLSETATATKEGKRFFDEVMEKDGIVLKKTVYPYPAYPDLFVLEIKAFGPDEQLLGQRKEIFCTDE